MVSKKKIALSALVAAMVAFTGCGGSDSGSTPPVIENNDDSNNNNNNTNNDNNDNNSGSSSVDQTPNSNVNLAGVAPIVHPTYTQAQLDGATALTGEITSDMTLDKDTLYVIEGTTKVKNGATINIPAGTVIFGELGTDVLVFTKGTKIIAEGTAEEPVIFTSETALLNPKDADVGQWGGLTILGNAPTNQADPHYEIDESDPDFAFGGNVSDDNSGILNHVYILNSGETIGTDLEINGLSLCGVGAGTVVENIRIENSSDDGIEIWGGTVNVTNATIINAQDDSFDLDFGWSGTATNIYVKQTETAHAGFEISSGGNSPMTSGKIVNFIIDKVATSDEGGIYIKDDTTAPTFINGFVNTPGSSDGALNVRNAMTADQKAAISFADVTLVGDTKYSGTGATDGQTRHQANDAEY